MDKKKEAAELVALLEPHLAATELLNLLAIRSRMQAPLFLNRSLSYRKPAFDVRAARARSAHRVALELQLPGLGSGAAGGAVALAALCHVAAAGSSDSGAEVLQFVPLVARALLVPPAASSAGWSASLELPITLPSGGLDGLAVVLLLRLDPALATLLQLTTKGQASKAVSCTLEGGRAFQLLRPGDAVLSCVLRPQAGARAGGAAQEGWARVKLAQLEVHLPTKQQQQEGGSKGTGLDAGSRPPVPAFSLSTSAAQRGSSGARELRFSLSVSTAAAASALAGPAAGLAGSKRKQPEASCSAAANCSRQPHAQLSEQQHQQQQQQQQQQETSPPVHIYYSNVNGTRVLHQELQGFRCPFSVCGLGCRGYAGLRQHLQASHSYHDYYFAPPDPATGACDIFARCHPVWFDRRGGFVPKEISEVALEGNHLLRLLVRTPVHCPFSYHCPRAQRALRFNGAGEYPRDTTQLTFLQEAEERLARQTGLAAAAAADEAGGGRGGARPSRSRRGPDLLSNRLRDSLPASTTTTSSEDLDLEEEEEEEEEEEGEEDSLSAGRGRRRGAAGHGGKRKPRRGAAAALARATAAAPAAVGSKGLALLTRDGRPRFYHSKTCTAMTYEELLRSEDSDDESDFSDWQRDCMERLGEQPNLTPEQRDFMFQWNLHVHRNPIYADADLPAALKAFAKQQSQQMQADTAFRRCYTAYLLSLWKFRLLTPSQLAQLTAVLPTLVG